MGYYNLGFEVIGESAKLLKEIKESLGDIVGFYDSIFSKSFITLFNFPAKDQKLELFDRKIQRIAHTIEPFDLHIKGYVEYSTKRTINLAFDAQSEKLITNIREKFAEVFKENNLHEGVDFIKEKNTHITIAYSLTTEQHKKAKQYFQNKTYSSSFRVPHFVLREHGLHDVLNTVNYEVQKEYELANNNPTLF